MKSNYHIFYESLIRTSLVAIAARSPAHFNRILGEGKSFLLLEEFSNEEARNLSKALQDQKVKTVEVANALPEAMKTVKGLLNKLASEIDGVSNTEEITVLSIKGDTKALKKKIENLNSVFMRVGNVTASVVETMINAADNLNAGGFSSDIKTMKLSDLEETGATTGSAEYQKVKKILNAVIKSFAVPEWQTSAIEKGSSTAKSDAGSAWGAITKFFGNLFAKAKEKYQDDAKGAFAADLRLLTIEQIIKLKTPMEAARTALQGTAQQGGAATATATADVANSPDTGSTSGPAAKAPIGSQAWRALAGKNLDRFKDQVNKRGRELGLDIDILEVKQKSKDRQGIFAHRNRSRSTVRSLTEHQVVEHIYNAYLHRLHEVLGETDTRDSRGNITISPGLKVRHKKTQLEYTVDSVGEDQSGDLVIRLRNPEEPRFEPSYGQKFVGEEAPLLSARSDPMAPVGLEPVEDPEVDLEKGIGPGIEGEEEVEFVVDEKEFEKDYEVK